MALTEASSDQLSFEDGARLLHSGKTLGSSFGDSRFCPMRTQGNEITDDMEQGWVEATTVWAVVWANSVWTDWTVVELLARTSATPAIAAPIAHQASQQVVRKQMHPNFFLHHFRVLAKSSPSSKFWDAWNSLPLLASAVDRGGRV